MQTVDPTGGDARPPQGAHAWGGWHSPLTAGAIAQGAGSVAELRACGDTLYWLESRPQESGRTTLLCAAPGHAPRELTPAPRNVRSRIHEYGGGAYLPTQAGIFFVDDTDGELYHLLPNALPRRLTDCGASARLGDFCWDPRRRQLLAVCERAPTGDHANPADAPGSAEPENLLVALAVDGPLVGPADLRAVHRGHDFYAAPRMAPDGERLAFVAWDHPNMPWDGTLLKMARLDGAGNIVAETVLAGSAAEAVQQPVWMADGALVFVSDQNGFWNLYRYDESGLYCLLEDGAEYAEAPWVLAQSSVAALGPGHLVAARFTSGNGELVLIDAHSGFASPLPGSWLEYESLCAADGAVAFIGRRADSPPAIVTLRLEGATETVVSSAWLPPFDPRDIAHAQPRTFRTRDGGRVHAYLYLPALLPEPRSALLPEGRSSLFPEGRFAHLPEGRFAPGSQPPLLVTVHGGPTARASATLNLRVQYFTTRGWAVLDVDYRGSSGYGRRYREALNGRWGQLDVADCEDAVRALLHEGVVDPARIAIRGSSAGGFTVLSALAASGLYGAGASLYGIGDLTALARETHKFESRYLETLVGDAAACADRSPVRRAASIRSAVLFLQGAEDRVVPPAQATVMAEALRSRGVPVAHIEFPGEGHGFRKAAHIERALESEYAFYCRVFGIEPATPLPPLEIENL